jgi:hypothetical protein
MPTPNPIIVASVGAMLGTSATWPRNLISASVAISPSTALTIGSSIAVTVPNANSRMITAAVSPTTSLLSVSGFETACPR